LVSANFFANSSLLTGADVLVPSVLPADAVVDAVNEDGLAAVAVVPADAAVEVKADGLAAAVVAPAVEAGAGVVANAEGLGAAVAAVPAAEVEAKADGLAAVAVEEADVEEVCGDAAENVLALGAAAAAVLCGAADPKTEGLAAVAVALAPAGAAVVVNADGLGAEATVLAVAGVDDKEAGRAAVALLTDVKGTVFDMEDAPNAEVVPGAEPVLPAAEELPTPKPAGLAALDDNEEETPADGVLFRVDPALDDSVLPPVAGAEAGEPVDEENV
jgi:hypothetical protein